MITGAQAAEIARRRAREKGWGLPEPLEILERRAWLGDGKRYEVRSDPTQRGTRAHFTIDALTGEILREGYVPR